MPNPLPPILAAALLAGCAATAPVGQEPTGTCQPVDQQKFNGRPATSEVGAELLRDSGAQLIRWVPEGTMVTMEFNPNRLTVRLDPQNRIKTATCG